MIKHPSGRPIRIDRAIGRPIWRIPDSEFATPRLNRRESIQATGFTHSYQETNDEGGMRGMREKDRRQR